MTPPAAAAPAVQPRRVGAGSRLAPGVRPPRRVSGPARRPAPGRAAQRLQRHGGLLLELLSALERLSGHRLIDRLIRGRAWLVLITFALIGIVTLQLALLKLNGAVGRTLQREAVLQRENASLSIENSELAAANRVQARAAQLGMEFTSSSALRFLAADPGVDLKRAAAALRASGTGSEEAQAGRAVAAASSSSAGAEPGHTEAGEATGLGSGAAGSETGSQAGSGASSTQASRASGEAATPQAAPSPAPSGSAPASSAGGTQASPNG